MGEGQERHRQRSKGESDGSLFDASSEPQPGDETDEDLTLSLGDGFVDQPLLAGPDQDATLSLDSDALARERARVDGDPPTPEEDLTLELPGWREPATGEIPRVIEELAGEPLPPLHGRAPGNFDALEDETQDARHQGRLHQPEERDDFLIPIERGSIDDATLEALRIRSRNPSPAAEDGSAGVEGVGGVHDRDQEYIDALQAHLDERRGSPHRVARETHRSSDIRVTSDETGASDETGTSDASTLSGRVTDGADESSIRDRPRRPSRHEVVSSRGRSQRRVRGSADRSRSTTKPIDGDNSTPQASLEERTERTGGPTERVKVVRTVTGIVLAIVLLLALKLGTVSTLVVVVVAVTTAAAEGYNLLRKGGYRPAALVGLLAVVALVIGAYLAGEDAIVLVIVAAILVSLIWFMVQHRGEQFVAGITTTMVMVVWVGLFGSFAGLMLRHSLFGAGGLGLLVGTLLCTTTADVFAFFGGSLFGKHKLAPAISPGKTIEGVIIGGVATVLVAGLVLPLIHPFTLTAGLLIGLAVAIIAPVGDLAESALKRSVSAKDSSRLLPGHGGMLDRIDGILIVLPVAFYLFLSLHLR